MERTITQVQFAPIAPKRKRVAAYARVSSGKDVMISSLSSQEESLSASENQKWRVKRNFENGMPWSARMLGYRYEDGKFVIVPGEAEEDNTLTFILKSGERTVKRLQTLKKGVNKCQK